MNPYHVASFGPITPFGDEAPPLAGSREGWVMLSKHGPCFVCDPDNPAGMRADFYRDQDVIRSPFVFGDAQMGPPGHAHGGSLAALLDEIMGAAAWNRRTNLLAVHLEYDLRRPTPVGVEVMASAWVKADGNRSIRVASEIRLPDGTVAVEASGVFAQAPKLFERAFHG
ncbi:Thioesterase superfamily protein [compost metagenome]